jgi:hypothetical protein
VAFIRMYGMQGDPGPRPAPKRKSAASGPRQKAARKRVVRSRRAQRPMQGAPKGPGRKKGFGQQAAEAFGAGWQRVRKGAPDMFSKLAHGDVLGMGAAALGAGGMPRGMGGGGRRSINPTNVKALRRSLRRVEGFERLVKRVDKMLGPVARRHHKRCAPAAGHRGKKR